MGLSHSPSLSKLSRDRSFPITKMFKYKAIDRRETRRDIYSPRVKSPSVSQESRISVQARYADIYMGTTFTLQPLSQSRSWYGPRFSGIAKSEGECSNAAATYLLMNPARFRGRVIVMRSYQVREKKKYEVQTTIFRDGNTVAPI